MFKKFSAQEIIQLVNSTNTFMNKERNPLRQMDYLRRMNMMDVYYYTIIRNRDFYLELFLNIQDAKHAYFQRREVNYKFNPPFDFYGDIGIVGQVYHAQELLEINAYVQFLLKHRICKELPGPLCLKRTVVKQLKIEEIQEEEKDIKIIHLE